MLENELVPSYLANWGLNLMKQKARVLICKYLNAALKQILTIQT
jgi:hypothetical protein